MHTRTRTLTPTRTFTPLASFPVLKILIKWCERKYEVVNSGLGKQCETRTNLGREEGGRGCVFGVEEMEEEDELEWEEERDRGGVGGGNWEGDVGIGEGSGEREMKDLEKKMKD